MTTFKTSDIENFLVNSGNNYAAACWNMDMSSKPTIDFFAVEKWFKSYFPSQKAHKLFREMECQCTQFMTL